MRRWDGLVDEFVRECDTRGLSPDTVKGRRAELMRFGAWLKRQRPRPTLESITMEQIVEYIRSRAAFHTKTSVCGVVSHLREMGEYLVRQGLWTSNLLRWIRGPKADPWARLPKQIGKAHLKALWEEAAKSRESIGRHQGLALLSVLYGTGLRRGEMSRLDLSDWRLSEGLIELDGRKTRRERRIPVPAPVARCIEAYLPHRQNLLEKTGRLQERALFVTRLGTRLRGERIGQRVHTLARRAKVPLVSLRQFRHTCASDLLESGVPLPQVQQILGHACIQTTMRYTSVADPTRRQAMVKHPLETFLAETQQTGGSRE
jgi:site-specific recombinase XerD